MTKRIYSNRRSQNFITIFPRPRSTPVDGMHYVHTLDRETLGISGGDLERVDLQLPNMVEHVKKTGAR